MKTILKFSLIPLLLHALTSQAALSVTNIARGCEANHSLFIKSDGSLWAMGFNYFGELGDGTDNAATNRPEQIVASGVTAIASGGFHSLFLKSDGSLWAMGDNRYGQLGDGTFSTSPPYGTNRAEQIVASGVTAVAAGNAHSLFLKSDGSLWAMGDNGVGELGDGPFNYANTNRPEKIVASGVTAVAAGYEHSLFLKTNGSLWAMGGNSFGELGDGTLNSHTNQPEQIVAGGVTAIAAGGYHSLFLKNDGSLWAMGNNDQGEFGDGTLNSNNRPEQIVANGVTAMAAGYEHSLFLKTDGSLWAMGRNQFGELGDGIFSTSPPYGTNQPQQIVASGVTAVAAGNYYSLFLKSNGSLWAMGNNGSGQLGDGYIDASPPYGTATPEQIVPSPQPMMLNNLSSKTNLQFTATCGFSGTFYLLAGTNLTQPMSQWTPVATNVISDRTNNLFSATLTNDAVNASVRQKFFILRSQ